MKKMARKNFRGGPLFSGKSSSSTASHSNSTSPAMGGNSVRRATWADKIREKLPPLGDNEYEVLWERGVLGVIFLESEKDGIPYVSKATESCISPAVSQGDILKFVNVVRSKDHSFSDFFKILATMKKPVLLRFERLSASTPSSDEDDASQLFGLQHANSAGALNGGSQYARHNASHEEGDPTDKLQKANSMQQKDQKPPKAARGTFWRTAKDSPGPGKPAQLAGPSRTSAGSERMNSSHTQRRAPSSKDHQVSPRDAASANGSGGHSSHSPLGPHEYQVYWETGSLGLFFGENMATNLPVVTRSTPSANPVVLRAVAVNDTLVSANGIKSADYTFEAFFGRLQQMNKPVRLVFRRKQPTDQAVIIKQGEQHSQRHQQEQGQQQLQQRQMHEQEQKRELYELRDQQEREQQQLREQEQLREQKQREQREQQLREQKQREQQLREQKQREQQQREREQQQLEKQRLEQQRLEQQRLEQQRREEQRREEQRLEQQRLEEQRREEQRREQQQREQQQREQAESRNRTPSFVADTASSSTSPVKGRTSSHDRTPSPTVKRASTPPPRQSSPRSSGYRRHEDKAHERTPPPSSPVTVKDCSNIQQHDTPASSASADYEMSPKAGASPSVRRSTQFGSSPSASPNIGSSPKVSSSPLASPVLPFVAPESTNAISNSAPSSVVEVTDDSHNAGSPVELEEGAAQSPQESVLETTYGKQRGNSRGEQRKSENPSTAGHEEESVLSPLSNPTHLSPTEPWDLPEQVPSPKVEAIQADADVDASLSLLSNAGIDLEHVAMAKEADFADEVTAVAELIEGAEEVDETELADVGFTEEVESVEEAEFAHEARSVSNLVEDSANLDVEAGMLASVEMGIAHDETESEVAESNASGSDQNTSPWDIEGDSDSHGTHDHSSDANSSHDEALSSSDESASIDGAENSKGDYADVSDPSDEFSHDPDISVDIDGVENDIMMQEASKDKMDSANAPKPNKSSLNANLAKYKKKGKTARGVVKLPALSEDDALTVPLVAPNAVNTTIQVRGRPKPKLTMADTPDSTTFLVKWKENRSIGLQLKEVRLAKGTYPLVTDVCQEPCCELLRHICVGDVIVEINGRNTSTMGVKKTVNFLKTCTKTTLMKIRHGPAFTIQRVSATV